VRAARATARSIDVAALQRTVATVAPLVAARLVTLQATRWRSPDRDRIARRLLPLALQAARQAARSGDADRLAALDQLVYRLACGMTAGEELLLADLVERPASLGIADLLKWHTALAPLADPHAGPDVELVAIVQCAR